MSAAENRSLRGSLPPTIEEARMVIAEAVRDKSYQGCPLGLVVRRYLDWKRDERVASESTVSDYEYRLARLCLDYPTLQLADFELPNGKHLIREFIARHWGSGAPAYARKGVKAGQRSPATKNKVRSTLSDFFKWCVREDLMRGSPMITIDRAKGRGVVREVYPLGEPERIFAACERSRDKCAVALTVDLGLRKGEVRLLKLRDYDTGRGILTVRGKGSKVRQLPVESPALKELLASHWLERLFAGSADEYLLYPQRFGWKTIEGQRVKVVLWEDRRRPLTNTPMHHWWKGRLGAAGVPTSRTMHSMRHTFTKELLETTGDLRAAQQALGHASIATTSDIYGHFDMKDLRAAMRLRDQSRLSEQGEA